MNTGQIVKSKFTTEFTVVPNAIAQSKELTMEEKGMLLYLLSLPENWVLYKRNLPEHLNEKDGTVDRVFFSLQNKGYILSVKVLNDKGQFMGWNHVVYSKPTVVESLTQQNPISDEPDFDRTSPIQKKEVPTKKENDIWSFEEFWTMYGRKVKRFDCEKKWAKLKPPDVQKIKDTLPVFLKSITDKTFLPHPLSYINGRRWEDELTIAKKPIPQPTGDLWNTPTPTS